MKEPRATPSTVPLTLHTTSEALHSRASSNNWVNLLIYMPVGVFGFLALRQNLRTAFAVTVTLLFALALSSGIEMEVPRIQGSVHDERNHR